MRNRRKFGSHAPCIACDRPGFLLCTLWASHRTCYRQDGQESSRQPAIILPDDRDPRQDSREVCTVSSWSPLWFEAPVIVPHRGSSGGVRAVSILRRDAWQSARLIDGDLPCAPGQTGGGGPHQKREDTCGSQARGCSLMRRVCLQRRCKAIPSMPLRAHCKRPCCSPPRPVDDLSEAC